MDRMDGVSYHKRKKYKKLDGNVYAVPKCYTRKTLMNETNRCVHPLKPIYDKASTILILGSFPSVKTREYGFFYGHPANRFWPLMAALFQESLSTRIEDRRDFLLRHRIALYDTILQCDIAGSRDASIQNIIPTDLTEIFRAAHIRQVYCNGTTAYRYYQQYHAALSGIEGIRLPSTSPANARYSMAALLDEWEAILIPIRENQ